MMVKSTLFFSLFLCFSNAAQTYEIKFDDGNADLTTVIGFYEPDGMRYHQRVDIPMALGEHLYPATVLLHVHVGSEINPCKGEQESRIALRVNGHSWHWKSLKPYMDNKNHWIEFEVSREELQPGRNRIETNSNVRNKGNMISGSLDMLGSSTPPAAGYSYHTHDFENYLLFSERNWGIRVKPNLKSASTPVSISIEPEEKVIYAGEIAQFYIKAVDDKGNPVTIADSIEWKSEGGSVNRYGGFRAEVTGKTTVDAILGNLSASHEVFVKRKMPPGIDPPGAATRLTTQVPEGHISLNGKWSFRIDPDNRGEKNEWFQSEKVKDWGEITVPGCWQAQGWGLRYHGVGWYKRKIEVPEKWKGENLWIRFGGACTYAKIWLNGQYIGEHLGNWSPFEFRITDAIKPEGKNVLIILVEERPRHFSAGFPRELGNFAGYDSHFGGLWQDVSLYSTGEIHIDDIFVMPGLGAEKVDVKATISGSSNAHGSLSCSIYKPDGAHVEEKVKNISFEGWNKPFDVEFSMPVVKPVAWRPDNPALYRAVIQARTGEEVSQKETIRFGMRDVKTEGSQLLLNGEPIYVRGMLHWGYYPNLFSITPSEEQIRREFQDLRACGFNLVKVCLFIFPRRFYEIADETGMLIWEEYPTWMTIPKPGDSRMREVMRREYSEWFRFDRNFPSIILRSLTCEAQNYDEEFLSSLYQLGKEMTNGSVMADNSGFLNHTITDWYDMHSYRELHDHYGTMDWIAKTVREKPEIKPFITGEDMDFDTYRDMQSIRSAFLGSGEIPWWLANNNFKEQEKFEEGIKKEINADAPGMMVRMQKRRALSVRQALFGEYRRHEEFAGYVMTSIRDNPYTRPGFYDDLMNPKWSPEEWTRFNADRVLIFRAHGNDSSTPAESSEQPRHSFCFMADEDIRFRIYFSNYGANLEGGELKWRLVNMDKTILVKGSMRVGAKRGELKALPDFSIALPQNIIGTQAPLQCRFETEIGEGETITRNDVPVWIFPSRGNAAIGKGIAVYIYSPKGSDDYAGVFPGLRGETVTPVTGEDKWKLSRSGEKISFDPGTKAILLTDHLDEPVKTALRKGAKVLYIPCEESGKDIPRYDYEIFWRESVIWLPPEHPLWGDFPHQGFVDLQFLDMTCKSPFNAEGFRDGIRPLIWGFNPRIPGYRIRDYVFESAVGEGKILACALNLFGERNPAGEYFLKCLLQYAASGDFDPKRNPGEHPLERLSGIRE